MANNKCIICGRKPSYKITLPHGTIFVCHNECAELLTLKINDNNSPVIWVGHSDLYEEDYKEILTKEEMENLTSEDMIEIAHNTADALGDYFWEEYNDALGRAAEWWRENQEMKYIKNCPKEDLPLLINNIKYENNKKIFEERLKE